ncbi:MAG TPA: DmsE family decaheme c-type cytochrome [Thermoanaerobaculia bacterium]|nr:DmsE family decaheme c-type cytochrome [Thermoanaerobaculia bacterium]
MRSHRLLLLLPLCALAVLALTGFGFATPQEHPSEPAAAPPATPQGYAGSDTCVTCHSDIGDHLATTPHGKEVFASKASQGCESCHGPGAAHAENPDDPALRPSITKLSKKQQSAICLSCHDGRQQFFWHGGTHEKRGVACTDCHSIHAFKSEDNQLKAKNTTEACLTCHKDVRAEMWKSSHHPIREGEMSCSDCHNPHGSQTPKMIKAVSVNEQCYTCHTEKRGPFLWEHPPVRENCLNCHVPHGSNHIKLQKTSVPFLCQQCHSNTRHPGTLYDGLRVPTLEDPSLSSNRLFNRACADCHNLVHGSNDPSAPYLGH